MFKSKKYTVISHFEKKNAKNVRYLQVKLGLSYNLSLTKLVKQSLKQKENILQN